MRVSLQFVYKNCNKLIFGGMKWKFWDWKIDIMCIIPCVYSVVETKELGEGYSLIWSCHEVVWFFLVNKKGERGRREAERYIITQLGLFLSRSDDESRVRPPFTKNISSLSWRWKERNDRRREIVCTLYEVCIRRVVKSFSKYCNLQ